MFLDEEPSKKDLQKPQHGPPHLWHLISFVIATHGELKFKLLKLF